MSIINNKRGPRVRALNPQKMKSFKVTYNGNSYRFRNLNYEINANSAREAVEKYYAQFLSSDYFPQDDGSIFDQNGDKVADAGDDYIEYDGGYFEAEEMNELKEFQDLFDELIAFDSFDKCSTLRETSKGFVFKIAGNRNIVEKGISYNNPYVMCYNSSVKRVLEFARKMSNPTERANYLFHDGELEVYHNASTLYAW